jgi:hypothetical protein
MTAAATLAWLRRYLRVLAAALLVGTVLELVLAGHFKGPMQLIPFGLCALGLGALAAEWRWPGAAMRRALQGAMVALVVGSLVGMGLHFAGNLEFARETKRTATGWALFTSALTGAAPLLAPGILAAIAAIAYAATAVRATSASEAPGENGALGRGAARSTAAGSRARRAP